VKNRVFKTYALLHVFCLHSYYAVCTYHHVGNRYRYCLERRERGSLWIPSFSKRRHAECCSNFS